MDRVFAIIIIIRHKKCFRYFPSFLMHDALYLHSNAHWTQQKCKRWDKGATNVNNNIKRSRSFSLYPWMYMSFAASCNVSNKYLVCRLVINVISPHFQSLWCVYRGISNNCIDVQSKRRFKRLLSQPPFSLWISCTIMVCIATVLTWWYLLHSRLFEFVSSSCTLFVFLS